MSRFHSYLQNAAAFITAYTGDEPFASFLKKQFAAHKKFGSRDRRAIAQLCYSFFRLGASARDRSLEEQILTGLFLCSYEPQALLQELRPEWNGQIALPLAQKLLTLKTPVDPAGFFPFTELLSDGIDVRLFAQSHLVQPDLFIRIRPGHAEEVRKKLAQHGIAFSELFPGCLALANGIQLEQVLVLNKEVVIQDAASQQLADLIRSIPSAEKVITIWDCCAASGGKSILAADLLPGNQLTVSDVRESILRNLNQRFREAGIHGYQSFVADLSRPWQYSTIQKEHFDLVIADVPCSGSGTWGRTPEYLTHFAPASIAHYTHLQRSILQQALPYLRKGGYLLYSTCSVFRKENEEQVQWLVEHFGLRVIAAFPIIGYNRKSDTMFGALLQKSG